MSQYYTINQITKILGISAQTLRNWDKKGTLTPHQDQLAKINDKK